MHLAAVVFDLKLRELRQLIYVEDTNINIEAEKRSESKWRVSVVALRGSINR